MADHTNLLLTDSRRSSQVSDDEYDRQLKGLVSQLRRVFSIKTAKRVEDTELLNVLHPAQNTLGYIFLLHNINVDRSSDLFIISLAAFLLHFDPIQARYAGLEWRRILDMTGELVLTTRNTDLLAPYRTAIQRMDITSDTLTTSHLHFVETCLQVQRPREALPLLDRDVFNFPYNAFEGVDSGPLCENPQGRNHITIDSGVSGQVTTLVVQEYYLLGAQVYIGQRNYHYANLFLDLVLSTPGHGNAVNIFMVEAYKKLVLVSLVARGEPPLMSQLVDQPTLRILSPVAKPYEVLSETFKSRNLARFHAEVEAAGSLWRDDGNFGLVQETAEALHRYRVIDLQKTYAAMPINMVASHLSMPLQTTLQLLKSMIEQGHLQATIQTAKISSHAQDDKTSNGETTVIRFHKLGAIMAMKPVGEDRFRAQVYRIESLTEAVKEADRRFGLTKEYGDWLRRFKKSADAGAAAYEDPMEMDMGLEAPGILGDDEDIMAT